MGILFRQVLLCAKCCEPESVSIGEACFLFRPPTPPVRPSTTGANEYQHRPTHRDTHPDHFVPSVETFLPSFLRPSPSSAMTFPPSTRASTWQISNLSPPPPPLVHSFSHGNSVHVGRHRPGLFWPRLFFHRTPALTCVCAATRVHF